MINCDRTGFFWKILVSGYLTPHGSQGFAPHYDDIEAFVIQLEGKKHWKLYPPRSDKEVLARLSSENMSEIDLGEPVLDKVLEAGDMLYFPRGMIHQGSTPKDSNSLHITISVYQRSCWSDYLEKLIPLALDRAITEDVQFREALPLNFSSYMGLSMSDQTNSYRSVFIKKAKELVDKLKLYIDADEAADELALDHFDEYLPPFYDKDDIRCSIFGNGAFWNGDSVIDQTDIVLSTEVRLVRPGIARLIPNGEEIQIHFTVENSRQYKETPPRILRFKLQDADLLEYFLSHPEYVKVQMAPGDDHLKKMEIATTLYNSGLLRTKVSL